MKDNKEVSLSVNSTNLLSRFNEAFTNKTTFFTELMQNAARSGASEVNITYSKGDKTTIADNLIIKDNGCGITNFDALFTVAESGWDIETIEKNNAFGIGFLSCIYACEFISIQSSDKQVEFSTNELLNGNCATIKDSETYVSGTIISMDGFFELSEDIISTLLQGYSIPVILNSNELLRPHCLTESFVDTTFGNAHVDITSLENGWWSHSVAIYLQGFRIDDCKVPHPYVIIHLNDSYLARLPDRDCLLDTDSVDREISSWLKSYLSEQAIIIAKTVNKNMSHEELDSIFRFCRTHNLKALNDVDLLPITCFKYVDANRLQVAYSEYGASHLENYRINMYIDSVRVKRYISRKEVEDGRVVIITGDSLPNDFIPAEEKGIDSYTFIGMNPDENIFMLAYEFDKNHWIHNVAFGDAEMDCVLSVKPINEIQSVKLLGEKISYCKGYELTLTNVTTNKTMSYQIEEARYNIYSQADDVFFITPHQKNADVYLSKHAFDSFDGDYNETLEDTAIDKFYQALANNLFIENSEDIIKNFIDFGSFPEKYLGKTITFTLDKCVVQHKSGLELVEYVVENVNIT